jgi:hypothetical protein
VGDTLETLKKALVWLVVLFGVPMLIWRLYFPVYHIAGSRLESIEPYSVKAFVLAVHGYDEELSPVDFGLGWDEMGSAEALRHCSFEQSGRFLSFDPKLTIRRFAGDNWHEKIANVHIIPRNELLRQMLLDVKVGDRVALKGHLVEVIGGGIYWKSSQSRKDTGAGACEVFLVTEMQRLDSAWQPAAGLRPIRASAAPSRKLANLSKTDNAITLSSAMRFRTRFGSVVLPAGYSYERQKRGQRPADWRDAHRRGGCASR